MQPTHAAQLQTAETESASHEGASLSPPGFSLTAGPVAQRQVDGESCNADTPTEFPYVALVQEEGAGLFREPVGSSGDDSARHMPNMERNQRVEVLEHHDDSWARVRRSADGATGYMEICALQALPTNLAESEHRPGIGYDGVSVADDLTHGDATDGDINDLGMLFRLTNMSSDGMLWADMRVMCGTLFSSGDLYTNIMAMIAHFQGSSGDTYRNDILNRAVRRHASTNRFLAHIEQVFQQEMTAHGGDALDVIQEKLNLIGNPRFSTSADTWRGGLTIAVNDVWAYDVQLQDYNQTGNSYEVDINLRLYDHFGLDKPDIEKKYKWLAGFRAWYVLQHNRGYRPFQVEMDVPHTFRGTINTEGE
ncbi:MAG: DUF3289 family protein [Bacteroidota bacterium]